jgi:hypothetical protein
LKDEIFAERVGEIALTGTMVRLDLVSLSATERDEKNQPKPEFRQRIVMLAEGFVQSFAPMAKVMQELEKKGVVRRAEAGETPGGVTVQPTGAGKPSGRGQKRLP